ncbi:MAG: tetratricopeptide repeat protein [Candidatus Xenobia bacterium]
MAGHPVGEVTLLFTDIQGSTEHWERLQDGFKPILDLHNLVMRDELRRWGGLEVKTEGDAFMIVFQSAADALAFAVAVQERLAGTEWPGEVGELLVRIGMHAGEPIVAVDPRGLPDYFGPPVNRAARVSAAAHGGQILLSEAVKQQSQRQLDNAYKFNSLGLHRLKGLEQPEEVFEVTHPRLISRTFPPIRTLNIRRHNLPVVLNSFVGREREMAEIKGLLRSPDVHVITLLGLAGIGKTMLALQVAAEEIEAFPDGVWFVELEACRTEEHALAAVAGALGLRVSPGQALAEAVPRYLEDRRLLLLLDNSEALPAARLCSSLLQRATGVKLLVTRSSLLHLRGERVYEVPCLDVPAAGGDAATCPAVRLFSERSRAANAAWELNDVATVAEICRQLDGHPLAIELAAARSRSLTPAEILARLNDRFKILVSRDVNVPERQRTLRGALDWSWEQLEADQREFLAQLSVFQNGFWLEAAEAVSGNVDAIDLAAGLQDRSLLGARITGQKARYYMLSLVRDHAAERLRQLPMRPAMQEAHARYYADRLEEAARAIRGPQEQQALKQLQPDLDNCRQARSWAREHAPALWGRIAVNGSSVLRRWGLQHEALEWIEPALQASPAAYLEYGTVLHDLGRRAEARAALEQHLAMGPDAAACNMLGVVLQAESRYPEARGCYEEALRLRRAAGDALGAARVLHNLAHLLQAEQRMEEAEAAYREVLELRRSLGDSRGMAETLNNLAALAWGRGELEVAAARLAESAPLWEALGDRLGMALARHNLGELYLAQHNPEAACRQLQQAAAGFDEIGSPYLAETRSLLQQFARNDR